MPEQVDSSQLLRVATGAKADIKNFTSVLHRLRHLKINQRERSVFRAPIYTLKKNHRENNAFDNMAYDSVLNPPYRDWRKHDALRDRFVDREVP